MNTLVKMKVNRLGRIGQIITVLLIISVVISLAVQVSALVEHIRILQGNAALLQPVEEGVEEVTIIPSDDGYMHSLIYGVAQLTGSLICYGFLMRVAAGFSRCDSPFEDGVIRRMSVFAWVLLIHSIVMQIAYGLPHLVEAMRDNVSNLYLLDALRNLLLPSFSLAVALFVMFLVRIFRHGAELQQEVDETL